MPRMPLFPASGSGVYKPWTSKTIRLLKMGCTNRPFFHIVVSNTKVAPKREPVIEQIGSYDPSCNAHNEKLVAVNYERLQFWMGQGVQVSRPVRELFGIGGLFPIHPRTFIAAWRKRASLEEEAKKEAEQSPADESVKVSNDK